MAMSQPEPSRDSRPELEPRRIERIDLEVFFLALGMIVILTLALALLMVPVIFWQRSPEILEDIWRKSFYGFLVLSLLFDVYLMRRQMVVRRLRRELEKQRFDREVLLAAKRMDEALLRSIGEGVFAVDSKARLILLNRQAEQWTGAFAREAISKPYRDVLRFEKLEAADFVERAMQSRRGVQVDGDAVLIRRDGSQMPVSILASPVIQDDIVRGCIVVFRDVTEQRAMDHMKSEFVSLASHQLRTPLTGLRWSAAELTEELAGTLKPEQQELLKEVDSCIQQMVILVNDLLDVARLDQGTLKLEMASVSPAYLLVEVVGALDPKAKKSQVALIVDESVASCPPVRADHARLLEAILNLVDNAIKYTPEGGEVRLTEKQEGHDLILSVSDTGVGIPEAEMHRLFEKFTRIENPLSSRERGSGLGLYFAKGIVEKHGGKIWVQSTLGKGTTFYVRLPLFNAAEGVSP